jgi:hypothetical protein
MLLCKSNISQQAELSAAALRSKGRLKRPTVIRRMGYFRRSRAAGTFDTLYRVTVVTLDRTLRPPTIA